jgi:precorrin-6Y C5,15-methyltransferase (decarboxylating)
MVREAPITADSHRGTNPVRGLGLPDDAFEQRRPLKGQITKREVRALALYSLGLRSDSLVWDIGSGTGSIAVEAGLIAKDGSVFAIERDPDSLSHLQLNVERWGSGNVTIVAGEAPAALKDLPRPDSVFIGGSGGELEAILELAALRLKPGGHIVINLAALERAQWAYHRLNELDLSGEMVMLQAARGKDMPGNTVRLESLNPVFVVTGRREA